MPGLIAYAIVRRRFLTGLADWRAWLSFAGAAAVVAGWFMLRERLSPGYLAAVWSYDVAGPMLSVLEGHRGGPAFCAWVLLRGFEPAMLLSPTLSAMPWDADPAVAARLLAGLAALSCLAVNSVAPTKLYWYVRGTHRARRKIRCSLREDGK
jgi:hypothetical protein